MLANRSLGMAERGEDGDALVVAAEDHGGPVSAILPHTDPNNMGVANAPVVDAATSNQEANFLYFLASLGITLNLAVMITVLIRRRLRKMTSAFLLHACFLNLLKAVYCIPFGYNLATYGHNNLDKDPDGCMIQGASYIIIITASAFNQVAMVCTEAYTFGELNIGGNSRGTICCVVFGLLLVYIASATLHLGPTLIGGYFKYNAEVGNCTFIYGQITGYIAHVMWIIIISLALVGVGHFLCKLYKEIQMNQTNRVSMLVRQSITAMETEERRLSRCEVQNLVKDAAHRARIFVLTSLGFIFCWYPLFLLIIVDVHFRVSPKVYQVFYFIAWSQGTIEPILYICFDRHLNLLARFFYCDRYKRYNLETLSQLMSGNASRSRHSSVEPGSATPCRHCRHEIIHQSRTESEHSELEVEPIEKTLPLARDVVTV